jgi:hypothetical protein
MAHSLARCLQKGLAMKAIVGIVAGLVVLGAGCGVGMDDPEGMAAVGEAYGQSQAALAAPGGGQLGQPLPPLLSPGGPVAAPLDPIPYKDPDPQEPLAGPLTAGPWPGK